MRSSCKHKKKAENPLYLNTGTALAAAHHIIASAENAPVLFTTELTECTGIGLFYKQGDQVKKMMLYHSYSEFALAKNKIIDTIGTPYERNLYDSGENFVRAVSEFLKDVNTPDAVFVVVHVNKNKLEDDVERPEDSRSLKQTKEAVNIVCEQTINGKIPDENFSYHQGNAIFCIMNDGTYYSPSDDKGLEEVAKKITMNIYAMVVNANRELGYRGGKSAKLLDGTKKTVSHTDKKLIDEIRKADAGKCSWVHACSQMKHVLKAREKEGFTVFGLGERPSETQISYDHFNNMLDYLSVLTDKVPALKKSRI